MPAGGARVPAGGVGAALARTRVPAGRGAVLAKSHLTAAARRYKRLPGAYIARVRGRRGVWRLLHPLARRPGMNKARKGLAGTDPRGISSWGMLMSRKRRRRRGFRALCRFRVRAGARAGVAPGWRPRGTAPYAARRPTRHGALRGTAPYAARRPTRHGALRGTAPYAARRPTRHGALRGTAPYAARRPTRHGAPPGRRPTRPPPPPAGGGLRARARRRLRP